MVRNHNQHLLYKISTTVILDKYPLPVAVPLVLSTTTFIINDDGLLRTNTSCAGPAFSITLYVDWLNDTEGTTVD